MISIRKNSKILGKIFLFIFFSYSSYAKSNTEKNLNSYFKYPTTYYAGFSAGFSSKQFSLYHNCQFYGSEPISTRFTFLSPYIGANWILINRFCANNFGGYPELGWKLQYSRTLNEGNIISLLANFAPYESYDSAFEIVPSFYFGVCYLSIPAWKRYRSYTPATENTPEYSYEEPESEYSKVPFRSEFAMQGAISLNAIVRFREHWKLKLSFGCSIIPSFSKISRGEAKAFIEAGRRYTHTQEKTLNETEQFRRYLLYSIDTTLLIPYAEVSLGYTNNITDVKLETRQPEDNYIKIKPFFTIRSYDKDSEFIWSLIQERMIDKMNESTQAKIYSPGVTSTPNSPEALSRYDLYSVFGVSLDWNVIFGKRYTFILGAEFSYDSSSQALQRNLFVPRNYPIDFSVHLGFGYLAGKLSFDHLLGFYLVNPKTPLKKSGIFRNAMYYKVGADYTFYDHWTLGCALRIRLAIKYDDYNDTELTDIMTDFNAQKIYGIDLEPSAPEISIGYRF